MLAWMNQNGFKKNINYHFKMIVIMNIELKLNEHEISRLNEIANILNVDIDDFINNLLKSNLKSMVYLDNEYKYDFTAKVLFYNEVVIDLTGSEKVIVEYLIKNERYVSADELIENCMFKNKMSIFSLRNKVMSIRQKTFNELIVHKKNIGYKININTY